MNLNTVDDSCPEGPFAPSDPGDRHPKWVRVEPGTVIPAGQPYRVEWVERADQWCTTLTSTAREWFRDQDTTVPDNAAEWFVDSSWKPPLVLPTEPTWGIAVTKSLGSGIAKWQLVASSGNFIGGAYTWNSENILDFIPLTDEQVKRIEAAR